MVGDVNLFLTDAEDPTLGEIEIMIAGRVLLHTLDLCCYGYSQLQTDVTYSSFLFSWLVQVMVSSEK